MNEQEDAVIQYIKTQDITAYTLLPWSTMTVGEYANQLVASYITKPKKPEVMPSSMRPTFYPNSSKKKSKSS